MRPIMPSRQELEATLGCGPGVAVRCRVTRPEGCRPEVSGLWEPLHCRSSEPPRALSGPPGRGGECSAGVAEAADHYCYAPLPGREPGVSALMQPSPRLKGRRPEAEETAWRRARNVPAAHTDVHSRMVWVKLPLSARWVASMSSPTDCLAAVSGFTYQARRTTLPRDAVFPI